MKNVTERLYLFTTWTTNPTAYIDDINALKYENLYNSLIANGRQVIKANGRYNGQDEPCFVLTGDNNFESIVADICKTHKQESFLVVYPSQGAIAELVFADGSRKSIGKFVRVNEYSAKKVSSYTKIGEAFYVCE